MPTGYTADLCNGDVPFNTFVLRCARNFGALIEMRDDPMDAPIPDKFEPSDYHVKALQAAEDRLAMTKALSCGEAEARAFSLFREQQEEFRKSAEKAKATADRLMAMRSKVADWEPPTSEHRGLKDFMIQQLDETIRWDCRNLATEPAKMTGEEWRRFIVADCERDIKYHTKHLAEDRERAEARTAWVKALRESLNS